MRCPHNRLRRLLPHRGSLRIAKSYEKTQRAVRAYDNFLLFRTNVSFFLPRSAIRKSSLWEDSRRSRQEGIAYQRLFYSTQICCFFWQGYLQDSKLRSVLWEVFFVQFVSISPKKKHLREEETVGLWLNHSRRSLLFGDLVVRGRKSSEFGRKTPVSLY